MVRRSWVYCTWRSESSQHAIEPGIGWGREFCLPHLHSTPPLYRGRVPSKYCHDVWCGKTRMVWLPDGKKKWKYDIIRFVRMYERDRRTDTAWRHRPRLHSIARQKDSGRRFVGPTIEANSWQTRSIARPLCDSRATCYTLISYFKLLKYLYVLKYEMSFIPITGYVIVRITKSVIVCCFYVV